MEPTKEQQQKAAKEAKRQQPAVEVQSKEVDGKTVYLDEPTGDWVSKK